MLVLSCTILLGGSLYITTIEEVQRGLDELLPAQRSLFDKHIENANKALEFGDINDVLQSLDAAFQIHAENRFVSTLFDQTVALTEQHLQGLDAVETDQWLTIIGQYQIFKNETARSRLNALH
jgi:hypothetical protein